MFLLRLLFAVLVLASALPARAGAFSVAPESVAGPPGGIAAPALLLRFAGDGASSGVQVDYRVDPALFVVSAAALGNGSGSCVVVAPGQVRMLALTFDGTPLPSTETAYCALTIAIDADVPFGSYPVTSIPGSALCAQQGVPVTPCVALDAPDAIVVELADELFRDEFE